VIVGPRELNDSGVSSPASFCLTAATVSAPRAEEASGSMAGAGANSAGTEPENEPFPIHFRFEAPVPATRLIAIANESGPMAVNPSAGMPVAVLLSLNVWRRTSVFAS
jgi:hypothetical protein